MDKIVFRALQVCPLFEKLSDKEIESTFKGIKYRIVEFGRNEVYVLEGSPIQYADIIISGEIAVKVNGPAGRSLTFITNNKGKLIAPSLIFNEGNVLAVTFETARPTVVLRMTPATLYHLINKDTRIQMNFIRLLSSTVHDLGKKLKILALYTIREKMADYILDEARRRNNDSFILSMSRQDIADMFAVQRFSVQRVLREFNEEGIIRLNGKYITILDKEKLEALNAI